MTTQVSLLDCTLRDGGYYNDWDFSTPLVRRYLQAMHRARITAVELGFRSATVAGYAGPTAFTNDRFIDGLDIPEGITLGVMMNGKELTADGAATVASLFCPKPRSRVDLVRIAANYAELESLAPAVDALKKLGYLVGINLMQIGSRSEEEVARFGESAKAWGADVAYFADSFGGVSPHEVHRCVEILRESFGEAVGCHMHDNMTMAFANTMAAVEAGATWVDATVLGMGRGPGNARTEYVAVELTRRGVAEHDALALFSLVTKDFAELQREYGWGSNLFYFLSGAYGIHPTYIQEMTGDGRYSVDEIVNALEQLRLVGGGSFSHERLEDAALRLGLTDAPGTWDARGWCTGRDVLIVGPGPGGQQRRADIETFICATRPIVIALNALAPVDGSLVDAYAICHPVRAMIDAEAIRRLDRSLFMPAGVAEKVGLTDSVELRDYGMTVAAGTFEPEATGCTVPTIAAFPYALALASIGGASRVLLTGFDGFSPGDTRQGEMEQLFALVRDGPHPPIVAMTRTSYSIERSSLFRT